MGRCVAIYFPFLISHFYLLKSSNHAFINSQRLKSDHREDQKRMRREYDYKIATLQTRISLLERYHRGSGERVRDMVDRSGREIGGGGETQGCGGAFGVAAGEYPIPASMHTYQLNYSVQKNKARPSERCRRNSMSCGGIKHGGWRTRRR
jgi:hypothetical protein